MLLLRSIYQLSVSSNLLYCFIIINLVFIDELLFVNDTQSVDFGDCFSFLTVFLGPAFFRLLAFLAFGKAYL